jgi:hypothetical protein
MTVDFALSFLRNKETLMSEGKTYEMMWDCEYCGATKLLGKTHRHCPLCGAAQNAEKRYFPPEEEKVAVEDHQFVGADWSCPACDTPNSKAAEFCSNCGSGQDGSSSVKTAADEGGLDEAPPPEAKPATDPAKKKRLIAIAGAVLVFFALLCGIFFMWTEEKGVSVQSHSWERSIEIDRYQSVSESSWKESVPAKAYSLRCEEKQKETKQVPDGEECSTVKKDNGDGTYREEEECKTKYRDEPVYGQWCRYDIDKWKTARTERSNGIDSEPSWPTPRLNECSFVKLGCERQGGKGEVYTIHFLDSEGEKHDCGYELAKWKSIENGMERKMEFRVVDGGIDCSTWDQE